MTQEAEPRWASLLQPIKQLERNWDIDIASELTDYLEELSGLTFEVDGLANLDFAEAAMVIHSSSCTYAKKVDYLLKLTHAAIDSAKAKQSSKKQRRAAAVDDDFKTPLDALRAIAAAGAPDNAIPEEEFSTVAAPEMQPALLMDVSQLASYPTVAHLVGPDRKDVSAAAAKESAAALMSPSDAPTFSLMRAQWHVSGALLLLPSDGVPYDHHFDSVASGAAAAAAPAASEPAPAPEAAADANVFRASPNGGFASFGSPAGVAASPEPFFGNGGVPQASDAGPAPDPGDWYGPDGGDDFALGGGDDYQAGADAADAGDCAAGDAQEDLAAAPDPGPLHDEFCELDPHTEEPGENKPFRALPKKKAARHRTALRQQRWHPFAEPDALAAAQSRLELLVPQHAPAAADKPTRAPRKRRQPPSELVGLPQPGPAFEPTADDAEPELDTPDDDDGAAAVDACGGGEGAVAALPADDGDFGSFAFDDVGDDEPPAHGNDDGAESRVFDGFGGGEFMDASQGYGGVAYDELVAQYSAAVAAAASAAQSQSSLARKVTSWRDSISRIMVQQDERPVFDVAETGQALVARAAEVAKGRAAELAFGEVVACEHKWQVARSFSAFLQQVNFERLQVVRGATPADAFAVRVAAPR